MNTNFVNDKLKKIYSQYPKFGTEFFITNFGTFIVKYFEENPKTNDKIDEKTSFYILQKIIKNFAFYYFPLKPLILINMDPDLQPVMNHIINDIIIEYYNNN